MSSAPTPDKKAPAPPRLTSRTRRITAHVLVALGSLIAVVALLGGYLRYQIFDSSTRSFGPASTAPAIPPRPL